MELRSIKTDQSTKATGLTIRNREKDFCSMLQERSTSASGMTIDAMEVENT